MKKISLLAGVILLSGCSTNAIDSSNITTEQLYDLSDPEGDGVINARDNCVDTVLGAAINNNGCSVDVVEKLRVTLLVNFENDSSVVGPKYFPEVQKLANLLKEYKSASVLIEGHTSKVGSAKYNKLLSLKRAEAVKSMLVNKYGVEQERIQAVGYGFEQLLFEDNSDYANAQNRRIVAEITGGKEITNMKWNIYSVDGPAQ